MGMLSKRLDSNTGSSSAAPNILQRRLVLSKVKAAEKLVGDTLSEIKIHIDNIENVIRFKKEDLKKMGGQVMFSKDKEIERNLEKLENAVNNLIKAFKQIQLLHEEMKTLSKEYGISLTDQERAVSGVGLSAGSMIDEEGTVGDTD